MYNRYSIAVYVQDAIADLELLNLCETYSGRASQRSVPDQPDRSYFHVELETLHKLNLRLLRKRFPNLLISSFAQAKNGA